MSARRWCQKPSEYVVTYCRNIINLTQCTFFEFFVFFILQIKLYIKQLEEFRGVFDHICYQFNNFRLSSVLVTRAWICARLLEK